jgi:hypothetical protein
MTIVLKFRLAAAIAVLLVGGVSTVNLVASIVRPAPSPSISDVFAPPSEARANSARLAAALTPFRSDLKAEYALALAGRALASKQPAVAEAAQEAIESSLDIGPHSPLMWLVLALLESGNKAAAPRTAEFLKMSYLTGQNRADLIPTRLGIVTSGNAAADSDLADFARGDVRAMLTQLPDQRQALVVDYARGSQVGRQFLETAVAAIEPTFVNDLKSR